MYDEALKRDFQSAEENEDEVLPLGDSILASWVRFVRRHVVMGLILKKSCSAP